MADPSAFVIEARNLTRVYGDGSEIRALDSVNLQITPGELVAIMGPSGSGKSTLLNVLGALDKPTDGSVFINGEDLSKIQNKDAFRAKTIGFVFQLHNLIPTLTARENIEIPMMGYLNPHSRHQRSAELLALVGLSDRMNHLPNQLSGGQRQRVATARSLANDPPIVLADEPTGSLDTVAGEDLMNLINDLNKSQSTTFVIVTHDPAIARKTRRIIIMRDGKIVREDIVGSPIEEDFKAWRHSNLGQQIISGDDEALTTLGMTEPTLNIIRQFLIHSKQEK